MKLAAVFVLFMAPVIGAVAANFHDVSPFAGVVLGLLGGVAVLCASLMLSAVCMGLMLHFRASLPVCRCGWDGSFAELRQDERDAARKSPGFFRYRCPLCGLVFRREGRRVYVIGSDGSSRPYAERTLTQRWRLA
jgi:hypothetical protein